MVGASGELSKALYLSRAIAIGIECEADAVATALCRRVLKRKLQVGKTLLDFAAAICRLASD